MPGPIPSTSRTPSEVLGAPNVVYHDVRERDLPAVPSVQDASTMALSWVDSNPAVQHEADALFL